MSTWLSEGAKSTVLIFWAEPMLMLIFFPSTEVRWRVTYLLAPADSTKGLTFLTD